MSDAVQELYQEMVIDHNRSPRNFGELEDPALRLTGNNPVCGDKLYLSMRIEDERISDIKFSGEGCAISVASASLMTDAVKGQTVTAARETMSNVLAMIVGKDGSVVAGKLESLKGVRDFPGRVKCATLAWHTLEALLDGSTAVASTE